MNEGRPKLPILEEESNAESGRFASTFENGESAAQTIELSSLGRGDAFIVETEATTYKVTVTGIRAEGLLVRVMEESSGKRREYSARIPGGFEMDRREEGRTLNEGKRITRGVIKVATSDEVNCFYLENMKDLATGEMLGRSSRSLPIVSIKRSTSGTPS